MPKRDRVLPILTEAVLFAGLAYFMLWKGGKSLSALWFLIFISVALIALEYVFFRKKDVEVAGIYWWPAAIFTALTLLSFIFSKTKNYGFDEVIQTAALSLLFFWTVRWKTKEPEFISRFMRFASFALLLACLIGIAVYVLQPVNRFVGTFFDHRFHTDYWPNAWAEEVLLVWPMLVWVLWGRKSMYKHPDVTKAAVTGLVMGFLFLSYSRGAIIAFIGQIILMGVLSAFLFWKQILWSRLLKITVVGGLVSIFVFLGTNKIRANFYPVESITKKATFSSDEGSSSISERRQFWDQAAALAYDKPLLGWGPYSFRFVQPYLQQNVLATSDHPHNVFLKYAMERGIPAALAFAFFVTVVLYFGIKKLIRTPSLFRLVIITGILGVLAHNLIDFNLQFQGIASVLFISLGLITDSVSEKSLKRAFQSRVEVIAAVVLFAITAFEGVFLFESFMARRNEKKKDFKTALAWYALTDRALFPRDLWLARSAIYLAQNKITDAKSSVQQYQESNKLDARAWRLFGDIYLTAGSYENSYAAYEKAFEYGRFNDAGIVRGLLYAEEKSGKVMMKKTVFDEIDDLVRSFSEAIEKNTHFIALSDNVEQFVSLCRLLSSKYPEAKKQYDEMIRKALLRQKIEKERYVARRGVLW